MTSRVPALSLLLLTSDLQLHAQLEKDFKKSALPATITLVRDSISVRRVTAKRTFDGVIVETTRLMNKDLGKIQQAVDPNRTFFLAGSRVVLRLGAGLLPSLAKGKRGGSGSYPLSGTLEEYLDSKLGDFVRGMKNGSARNLHPMLIKAVERPLISHALRETNGNQIKTAHLLGMNRNTLRKKISELRIPIKREKNKGLSP